MKRLLLCATFLASMASSAQANDLTDLLKGGWDLARSVSFSYKEGTGANGERIVVVTPSGSGSYAPRSILFPKAQEDWKKRKDGTFIDRCTYSDRIARTFTCVVYKDSSRR
jgi:hypothetical protein